MGWCYPCTRVIWQDLTMSNSLVNMGCYWLCFVNELFTPFRFFRFFHTCGYVVNGLFKGFHFMPKTNLVRCFPGIFDKFVNVWILVMWVYFYWIILLYKVLIFFYSTNISCRWNTGYWTFLHGHSQYLCVHFLKLRQQQYPSRFCAIYALHL